MTHGWPGSVVELGKVIGPLTDPERYGGDRADAFHLVCPSLPGYGSSGKPDRPGWGVQHIADAWAELMGRLGYQRYAAQGGDWGATVTTALSGSEQNPDLTGKSIPGLVQRARPGPPAPVAMFMRQGADFVVRDSLPALVAGMNELTGTDLIDLSAVTELVTARDREVANPFSKDAQLTAVQGARRYRGDRLIRVAKPHRFLDPAAGPLIAVRLHILTRKSLGGLQTNLDGQVLGADGQPVPGLYAAGEVAGFGGGGMHGYRALEGTFLGGCLFSGRIAGRHAAKAVA